MRIVRYPNLKIESWKNGRGVKRDIAEDRDSRGKLRWLFSISEIERDVPFSTFPGVDCWVLPLTEGEFELEVGSDGERKSMKLGASLRWFRFSGDETVYCRLLSAPLRAFDMLTDRDARDVKLDLVRLSKARTFRFDEDQVACLLLVDGECSATTEGASVLLGRLASLVFESEAGASVEIRPTGESATLVVASLRP